MINRRKFLAGGSVGVLASLSGCADLVDSFTRESVQRIPVNDDSIYIRAYEYSQTSSPIEGSESYIKVRIFFDREENHDEFIQVERFSLERNGVSLSEKQAHRHQIDIQHINFPGGTSVTDTELLEETDLVFYGVNGEEVERINLEVP